MGECARARLKAAGRGFAQKLRQSLKYEPLCGRRSFCRCRADPIEWTDAVDTATIALRIYPGKDAEFTLYEDSGDGYQCEDGDYATINLYWYDRRRTLFIEQRKGHYTPKLPTRHFRIQLMDTNEERTIVYDGKAIKVCIK